MPVKLSTTINSISSVPNPANSTIIHEFHQYVKSIGTSENYQNGNLKIIIYFGRFLGPTTDFYSIQMLPNPYFLPASLIGNTEHALIRAYSKEVVEVYGSETRNRNIVRLERQEYPTKTLQDAIQEKLGKTP